TGKIVDVREEVHDDIEAEQADQADQVSLEVRIDELPIQECHAEPLLRPVHGALTQPRSTCYMWAFTRLQFSFPVLPASLLPLASRQTAPPACSSGRFACCGRCCSSREARRSRFLSTPGSPGENPSRRIPCGRRKPRRPCDAGQPGNAGGRGGFS